MFSLKRKRKTGYGEQEVESINWPLIGVTLTLAVGACGLLYLLVYPALFGEGSQEPEYVIVPYGQEETPSAPLFPSVTPGGPPSAGPTPTPPTVQAATAAPALPITVQTALRVEPVAALLGHSSTVSSVAFSPDGRFMASGDWDGIVKLWNAADGVEIYTFRSASNRVDSVAFNADSTRLAAGGHDNTVRLWDLTTGTELSALQGPTGPVTSVAFSPAGGLLAAGSDDGSVYVWNTGGAQPVAAGKVEGHTSYVTSVAFSPDGTLLAAGGADDTIRLWRMPAGTPVSILIGHTSNVSSVAFSSDGSRLASTGDDHTVRLWDVRTLAATQTANTVLNGHTENVTDVAFSLDGSLVVSAAGGIEDNTVRLWDAATGAARRTLYPTGPANAVAFSPDGRTLAVGGATYLSLWQARETSAVQAAATVQPTATFMIDYDTPGAPDAEGCVLVIGADGVTLRAGPGARFDAVGTLPAGQQVQADGWTTGAEEGFTWWRLDTGAWLRGDQLGNVNTLPDPCWALPLLPSDGSSGPAATGVPTSAPGATPATASGTPDRCVLTAKLEEINLRSGPGTAYDIVTKLAQNQQVTATGWAFDAEQYVWWRLDTGAWVRADTVDFPDICLTLPQVTP